MEDDKTEKATIDYTSKTLIEVKHRKIVLSDMFL
jgi:hypothetical protein